ncbi:hypothetical protein C0Q70_07776 [Pomacea canaliculata]|uniref:SSD domain-containing protein n=1 Tax=Pomacea canaliculata TaxID=400727 RepID=A0A2T7PFY9_POMCA|nr:hypothetical protein C0Q70_07776 [Pomacea canaliculata]
MRNLGITLGIHVAILIVTLALAMWDSKKIVNFKFDVVPLDLQDDPTFLRSLAWKYRDEDGTVVGKDTDVTTIGERSQVADSLVLMYLTGDSTVFTKERLLAMKQLEDRLLRVEEYKKFCRLTGGSGTRECAKPISILRFFDGTYGPGLNDTTFSNIPATLFGASQVPLLAQLLQLHLGVDGSVTQTEAKSSITRTIFQFGLPLDGYNLKEDNKTEQLLKIRRFQADFFSGILNEALDSGVGDMDFLYFGTQIVTYNLLQQVIWDLLLAVGSLLFIFLFVLFMTKSLFLTSFGIFSIISSFVIATLVYSFIFQYKYFGIFHVLSIFIILGIGADNIFVFVDNWRATAHLEYTSLEARLSACYKRAAIATFCTSLTTMVAFFSNALSPLLAVQSFGLFSGILVFVNYMSVIIFFPAVLIMYHYYWDTWSWPCFRCKKPIKDAASADGERRHPIVRFFRGPFYNLVSHRVLRWVLLALCLGIIIVFSVFAAKLKPDEESIKYYKNEHHFGKAALLIRDGFKPSTEDKVIKVYMVWGLREQDLSTCAKTDINCKGVTVWDKGFDLNPKRAQSALLDFCEKLKNLSATQNEKLHLRRNPVTGSIEVQCFLEHINTFMKSERNKTQYPANTPELTLPTSESKVEHLILNNSAVYNVTSVNPLLYRQFEVS